MTDLKEAQVKHMANRFLCWKLPEHFEPDAGIRFDPIYNKGTPYERRHEPMGTNLFGYDDALAMVRFMVEGMPEPSPDPSIAQLEEELARIVDDGTVPDRVRRRARAALHPITDEGVDKSS